MATNLYDIVANLALVEIFVWVTILVLAVISINIILVLTSILNLAVILDFMAILDLAIFDFVAFMNLASWISMHNMEPIVLEV